MGVWEDKSYEISHPEFQLKRKILPVFIRNRFGAFGNGSVINRPMLLCGKKYLYIGNNVFIRDDSRIEALDIISQEGGIYIEDNVTIEQRLHMVCASKIEIGHDSTISYDVMISDCSHSYQIPHMKVLAQNLEVSPVRIGPYCFIGAGAKIFPGVSIGENSIVGANSVVNKSVPPFSVVGGVPARVLKQYDQRRSEWVKV